MLLSTPPHAGYHRPRPCLVKCEDLLAWLILFYGRLALCISHSLLVLGINIPACLLDAINQRLSLHHLLAHIVDGPLQDQSLRAALSLQPRHKLRKAVEALANRLTTLLFYGATLAFHGVDQRLDVRGVSFKPLIYLMRCGSASSPPLSGAACRLRLPRPQTACSCWQRQRTSPRFDLVRMTFFFSR